MYNFVRPTNVKYNFNKYHPMSVYDLSKYVTKSEPKIPNTYFLLSFVSLISFIIGYKVKSIMNK